jgi:hypothetical protein
MNGGGSHFRIYQQQMILANQNAAVRASPAGGQQEIFPQGRDF